MKKISWSVCLFLACLVFGSCHIYKYVKNKREIEKLGRKIEKTAQKANDNAESFIEEMSKEIGNELLDDLPKRVQKVLAKKSFIEGYELSYWLHPYYLKVDFEGDGDLEHAVLIINKISKKKGYVIVEKDNYVIHGAGEEFGAGGNDFNWLEYWEVIREETIEVTIVEDGEIIGTREVINPSEALLVKELEGAGGYVIKEGEYKWLQLE